MSGVALRERDRLGYPIPLDTLGFRHSYAVADRGERFVRGTAELLVIEWTSFARDRVAVHHMPQQVSKGLGHRSRHCHGAVGEDLKVRELVEGYAIGRREG